MIDVFVLFLLGLFLMGIPIDNGCQSLLEFFASFFAIFASVG